MTASPDAILAQSGRASMDFMVHLARGSAAVRAASDAELALTITNPASLPDDLDERHARIVQSMAGSRSWRVCQLLGEWHADMHGLLAREAFEDIAPAMASVISHSQNCGPATLESSPASAISPSYWAGVNFHRTAGGWDDHPMQGYIHGEIIHKRLVEAMYPGGIFKQRRDIAARAPKEHYADILDMGASTGHFTTALQETYPEAHIVGVDLSLRALEHAQRVANINGWAWQLYQRPAEDTGFADASFDLVASYILLHEIPADIIRKVFVEAFRVLRPGGDMIMSDVTRYDALDKLGQWKADVGARWGGEPFWRESAQLDLAEVAREAGFVEVTVDGFYPHVVQGRKPA